MRKPAAVHPSRAHEVGPWHTYSVWSGRTAQLARGAMVIAAACFATACHATAAPVAPRRATVSADASAPATATATPVDLARSGPDSARPAPARRRIVTASTQLVILEPLRFHVAAPALDARSAPMLDAIAAAFIGNPDLEIIEVRAGGPDAPAGAHQRLGLARAEQVVDALVARGVARARLRPVGVSARAVAGPEFLIVRRRSTL